MMESITKVYQKGYSTLLFLSILLSISIWRGYYKVIPENKSDFTILEEIYKSLYNSESVNWATGIALGVCIILALIGILKLGTIDSFLHYFSLFLSALFSYFIQLWLLFFDLFGYSGHMDYIFPHMKIQGTGVGLGALNIVIGAIFILVVMVPPLRVKEAN